jgi:site-specific DNA-methyltransferase (adenine-specific)
MHFDWRAGALEKVAGGSDPVAEGLLLGDNLPILERIPDGSIDLVYTDPPFGTGNVRRHERIRLGAGDRTRSGFGGRVHRFVVTSTFEYDDSMPLDEYLEFLWVRLVQIHRVLTPHGSLYLHLDYRSAHHARFMLDELFGPERFLNEIIWAYDYGGRSRSRWPAKHDNILWYSKGPTWVYNIDEIDRVPYMAPSLVGPVKAARGKVPTDVWWMTIVPTNSRERTGYPTQKPVALVERIIRASSRPGDLVADFFCGSGTTGVAATRLGRRFLLVDSNPAAIAIAKGRLAKEPSHAVRPTLWGNVGGE